MTGPPERLDLDALDTARWRRIEAVLDRALDLPAPEQAPFLERACAGDPLLRLQVEALLAADRSAGDFLERPALERAAGLLEEAMGGSAGDLPPGARVGPWRVVREIGRGGMGVVYLAERADGAFEQRAALKLVKRGLDTDEILARFLRERRILARLEHPNIARLLDGGVSEDGRPYFAMEYVEGEPITAWCDRRGLAVGERLGMFLAACEAVQYAHRSLVVHRDLKPSNILADADGRVRLLDFGIARVLAGEGEGDEATLTVAGRVLTPQYAAPEQLRGEPASTATDVYALGLVLYELLTGRRPYRVAGRSPAEVEKAVLEADPEAPSRAVARDPGPGVPWDEEPRDAGALARRRATTPARLQRVLRGDLDTIVLTALRPEPERRYPSVEALAEDLARWQARLPIRARATSRAYRLGRTLRRHRLAFGAGALLFAVLVAWGATLAVMLGRQQRERVRAEAAARRAGRVQEFLVEMLAAAGPEHISSDFSVRGSETPDLKVREALDRAAAGVESKLANDPGVLAAVQHAIGESYLSLQVWDRAEAHLRAATALHEQLGDSEGLARSTSLLGTSLERQRRAGEALPLAERVLAIQRRTEGPRSRAVATGLQNYAAILNRLSRPDEAERAAREGLSILDALPAPDEARRAELLNSLWATSYGRGRYAESESLQREVLARVRKLYGDSSLRTAIAMNNLSSSIYSQKRWPEAESLQRIVLGLREARLGLDHPEVVTSINALAMTLRNLRCFTEAESLFHRAIGLRTRLLGAEHRDVLVSRSALANLWKEQGRLARAEAEHRAVLAIRRRALDPGDPLIASSLTGLGETLALGRRYAEAEGCLREALERRERGLPAGHPEIASAREGLAKLYEAQGRKALAAELRAGRDP